MIPTFIYSSSLGRFLGLSYTSASTWPCPFVFPRSDAGLILDLVLTLSRRPRLTRHGSVTQEEAAAATRHGRRTPKTPSAGERCRTYAGLVLTPPSRRGIVAGGLEPTKQAAAVAPFARCDLRVPVKPRVFTQSRNDDFLYLSRQLQYNLPRAACKTPGLLESRTTVFFSVSPRHQLFTAWTTICSLSKEEFFDPSQNHA